MINQQTLFQIYQSMTGKTMYVQENILPQQQWQPARVQEYAFVGKEVDI